MVNIWKCFHSYLIKFAPKTKNFTFSKVGGGMRRGPPFINFNLNYYWGTYENVTF